MIHRCLILAATCALLAATTHAAYPVKDEAGGDIVVLTNGITIEGCYIRDDALWYVLWDDLADVANTPGRQIPRSQVEKITARRGGEWDVQPQLPDLSVTYIEQNPKLPGLHGQVHYEPTGACRIKPRNPDGPLHEIGENYTSPAKSVKGVKFQREIGDKVTLTAHVKNVGFATAEPFALVWEIDGREVQRDRCPQRLREMEQAEFTYKYTWAKAHPTVTVRLVTDQKEIATSNNELTDAMWGFAYTFIVSPARAAAWHQNRTAYGTFSFEDFYQWHVQMMNWLFAHSRYPACPDGPRARVRLDRIIYAENPAKAQEELFRDDGIRYDQGGWTWNDSPEEIKTGNVAPPSLEWRNRTEWSLPHELGHQLGLIDWYNMDTKLEEDHPCRWPDNDGTADHFQNTPNQMMHWHGPNLFGEVDAAVLDMTWDQPRGYFGDFVWAMPRECFIRVVDINGNGVADANIEIYQKATEVKEGGNVGEDHGVKYFECVEDGNFYTRPVSKKPVIIGQTNWQGVMRLPNRPAKECRTLLGFHRTDNPFGNMNVVGNRGTMFVRITKPSGKHPQFFSLDLHDFLAAWHRGHKDKYMQVLQTPYGSEGSPPAPVNVAVAPVPDRPQLVKVTWKKPEQREQNYLDHIIGYKIYRRISNDCLNDAPWHCIATVSPDVFEYTVDLKNTRVNEIYWFSRDVNRFAVSAIGNRSAQSKLAEVLLDNAAK